ncbi:MAG TPA: TonB-dependent receptor [Steroidobacteraceae bacterium]|nr:TonB-dependent receptor [Steroidobacteraceae bacterium]
MTNGNLLAGLCALSSPIAVLAGGAPTQQKVLEEIIVNGKLEHLSGAPTSASVGVVTAEQLELRPVLRTGELLEVVPGLIVTQHSGDGKANQYFLRGFNLDHGTDLATSVDGVPVNMRTHAHGQGYTDVGFVIPELVSSIEYRKGTYYAEYGDFSAAGAVDMRYRDSVPKPVATLELGDNDYRRALLVGSAEALGGTWLVALERATNDGPWKLDEDLRRSNAVLRYSQKSDASHFSVTAQGYDSEWRSTDQIPLRAVRDGSLDRFGFIDPTDGGESHRYSLSADWTLEQERTQWRAQAYAIDYRLDLFSNFTYATDADNGDQFEQFDDRRIYGGQFSWTRAFTLGGRAQELSVGFQSRIDDIGRVALYRTQVRERLDTVRSDSVTETSYALYSTLTTQWAPKVRTAIGVRADDYEFDVDSQLALNSGKRSDTQVSPKASLVLGPWRETEFFFNAGTGFHSNDARGTTARVDPSDGVTPLDRVDPLVEARAAEVGLRTALLPNAQVSLSLWQLKLDSELVYVGDEGVTEASRASRRRGVEIGAIWNPVSWLIVDADYAWSRARFSESDPAGNRIPNAVDSVASVGVAVDLPGGWFGGARFRHFGSAPLIEDGSVRSNPTTLVNLEVGYRIAGRYKLSASVFNLFDAKDNDITYYYASQLQGEPEPVDDIHFHPVEPRTLRVSASVEF